MMLKIMYFINWNFWNKSIKSSFILFYNIFCLKFWHIAFSCLKLSNWILVSCSYQYGCVWRKEICQTNFGHIYQLKIGRFISHQTIIDQSHCILWSQTLFNAAFTEYILMRESFLKHKKTLSIFSPRTSYH